MASKNTLNFDGVGVDTEYIDINGNGLLLTFAPTRYKNGQATIAPDIASQTKEFYSSFELDYNRLDDYTVTYDETTVSIEHPDNAHFNGFVDATHNNASNISTAITTTTQRIAVTVDVTFSAHTTNKCDNVAANLLFNQTIDELRIEQFSPSLGAITIYDNASFNTNTVDVVLDRTRFLLYIYATVNGVEEFMFVGSPKKLTINSVDTDTTVYGGQAEINISTFIGSSETQYALINDINGSGTPTYEDSNVFNGLAPGSYTAYAKDKYGCVRTDVFTITDEATNQFKVPLNMFVSGKNPIALYNRNASGLTSNQFQFFASEAPELVSDKSFKHIYAESQLTREQFRSSYPIHSASLQECNAVVPEASQNEIPLQTLNITQYTDNINRNTFLEGNITYNGVLGRLLFSFTPGNEYNANGSIIGTHSYNGTLPAWIEEGTPGIINGEYFTVQSFYEDAGVRYAVTSLTTNSTATGVTIETVHQALDYETFYFDIDFSDVGVSEFYLHLNGKKGNSRPYYISEKIKVISDEDFSAGKWHEVKFYNTQSDTEIDYIENPNAKFGVTYRLKNIEYITPLIPVSSSEIETEKLDNKMKKLDYKSVDLYESNFNWLPIMEAKWLKDIFNDTEYFNIDGVTYTTVGQAELEKKGQMGVVKVKFAVVELSNEFKLVPNSLQNTNAYYPVANG